MSYIYSDPRRENDPHALPDVEVFYVRDARERTDANATNYAWSDHWPDVCEDLQESEPGCYWCIEPGWYWQACFPGCMPDGEPNGPFDTEAEAVAAAQADADIDDDADAGDALTDDEPGEEDYYLSADERAVYYCGEVIARGTDRDSTMRALAELMEEDDYRPDVWMYSDHGNPSLISVLECGCYFTEHGGDAKLHGSESPAPELLS